MKEVVLELRNIARHYREGEARLDILIDVNLKIFQAKQSRCLHHQGPVNPRYSILLVYWSGPILEKRLFSRHLQLQ